LSALALLALTGSVRAQWYAVTDLGTLGGTNCLAYGINNHEQIVGASQTARGNYHGFMFYDGWMMDVGTLGGSNSWCYGVNDDGWMVGTADLPWTNMHAFVRTNALLGFGMMDLGTLGGSNSAAWMINLHGEMVGWAATTDGSHHAFFMTNFWPGWMMDLGTAGGTNSEAYCINSDGMVVGGARMWDGSVEPILTTNAIYGSGSMMTMGMGGMGALGGQSWFVNDLGNTAGQAEMPDGNHHAFITASGGMMGRMELDLGTLGGTNSVAYSLNNSGIAVGMAELSNGAHHAFMATSVMGGSWHMTDLNGLVPTGSGWELMEARGINSAGQITGWGMHDGRTNGFLLTPVSAPVIMTAGPSAQIVGAGAPILLQMQMSASEPLTYQWLRDGVAIPGATNATLKIAAMGMGNAGQYTVTARNAVGTVARASVPVGMFGIEFGSGTPRLTVAAPAGSHFRIDYSETLGGGANWQTMTEFTMAGSTRQVSDTPPAGTGSRFYRAVMLP